MLHYQTFTVNPIFEHPYLVWDDTLETVIIDPGFGTLRTKEQLTSFIRKKGLRPVRCVMTHCHLDHLMGASFVQEEWGLEIEASSDEIGSLPSLMDQFDAFSMEVPSGVAEPVIIPFLTEAEGTIRYGERTLEILSTPGHTAGGVSFLDREAGAVFTGDSLFAGGYGRSDLWGGDEAVLLHSIREVLFALSDDTIVYPGHGPFTTIGEEKKNFQ
jgi:hydroxyacylglutathione hydrolase